MYLSVSFAQNNTNNKSLSNDLLNDYTAHKYNKLTFGIHLSPTISWLDINHDDMHTDGATITGGLGLIAEYNATKTFSFLSGINFNMPSGYVFDSFSLNDPKTDNNYLLKFNTIEIPLQLKIRTQPLEKIIYYTKGGINTGIILSSKEIHYASNSSYDTIEMSYDNFSNLFDISYSIGVGASYVTFKDRCIFGEVNYKSSLTNLASKNGFTHSERYTPIPVPEIYSGNLVFTIGLMF